MFTDFTKKDLLQTFIGSIFLIIIVYLLAFGVLLVF
jgi:hypothetical protein